jgi:hypothetical protein
MVDLADPASTRMLLKKLWCHGQLVAPLQGCAYAYWAVVAAPDQILPSERVLLWVSAGVLPFWGWVSWRQMHSNSANAGTIILRFGAAMEVLHTAVVALAAQVSQYPPCRANNRRLQTDRPARPLPPRRAL